MRLSSLVGAAPWPCVWHPVGGRRGRRRRWERERRVREGKDGRRVGGEEVEAYHGMAEIIQQFHAGIKLH